MFIGFLILRRRVCEKGTKELRVTTPEQEDDRPTNRTTLDKRTVRMR